MFYLPTGGGKTVCGEAMIRGAVAKGGKALFIANRKQLVAQASAHLTRAGIAHGILQAENTCRLDSRVLVCSIDTIAARGIPDDVTLLVIDEAHAVAGSKKYRDLLFKYNRVPVVGLSATPFSKGLGKHYDELCGALFQDLVVGATIRELIDLGSLVDVDVYAPAAPDLKGVKIAKDGDYVDADLARAMDKPGLVGDIVAHWRQLAGGAQTVVFATNIAHSQHIVAEFMRAGVKAEHIDYHHTDDERADILGRCCRGEFTVLSNSALLAEGWDCPETECMVLARPTKSLIRYLQMAGRILRPHSGKERALLLDHSGSALQLGFPTDDLPLELDDGRPNKAGKRQREKPEPKSCPSCKYVRPAGVHACPRCGFAPQRQSDVEVQDGDLVKLGRDRKPAKVTREEKSRWLGELRYIGRKRGHSDGWADNRYRDKFGVWPRGLDGTPRKPSPDVLGWLTSQQIAWRGGQKKARMGAVPPEVASARIVELQAQVAVAEVRHHG
jgi:superfamily II DNA or RNA helicase